MTPPDAPTSLRHRAHRFWARHRRLFWILHSVWALATGVVVIVLARERYGFLPWVVAFIGLTWASTLFFGRRSATGVAGEAPDGRAAGEATPGVMEEVTSYLTRIMYQETLFFLLPFYAYSTVWGSPNVVFLVILGALALVSCLDLAFDRWLRVSPVFGLLFFATVAFAGVNLVLPILWNLAPRLATPLAAGLAVAASATLAWRATRGSRGARLRLGAAGVLFLAVVTLAPSVVPPVPIRLESAVFTSAIDRRTLAPSDSLGPTVAAGALPDGLVMLARVFAPSTLPVAVSVEWARDGETVRTSREVEVLAHDAGFRVWDALRPGDGALAPGAYEVILWSRGRRVFGTVEIEVVAAPDAPEGAGPGTAAEPGRGSPRLARGRGSARP